MTASKMDIAYGTDNLERDDDLGDLAGKENLGMRLFWVQLAALLVASIITLVRVYVKVFLIKKVSLDDWLMFFGATMYIPYSVLTMHGAAAGGTGKVVGTYTPEQASISLRAWYLCEVLYPPLTNFIRVSICIFILRIANQNVHRWIIYINIAVITLISVAYFFVCLLQCSPPEFFWTRILGNFGTCIDENILPDATIAHSVVSAVSDWIVGLMPIVILWKVQINRRTKASLMVLLSLGIFAGIVILIRVAYLKRLKPSLNFLYETLDVAVWSVFEPALGILAGSIPTLRPLFRHWRFGIFSSNKRTTPSQTPTSGSPNANKNSSHPSYGNQGMGYYDDLHGSETELHAIKDTVRTTRQTWDVERGEPQSEITQPGAVHIHTQIKVSSETVARSSSSDGQTLARDVKFF